MRTSEEWEFRGLVAVTRLSIERYQALSALCDQEAKTKVRSVAELSLSIAPAMVLAQSATFVDLDAPLELVEDRPDGIRYVGQTVFPAAPAL